MADRYDEQMFLDYVEGDLGGSEKDQFENLMAQDPQLCTLVTQVLDDRRRLRQWPSESSPRDVMEQVRRRLERNMLLDVPSSQLDPATPRRRFRLGRWMALGGLAAMVLLSTAVVVRTLIDQDLYDQFTPVADDRLPLTSPADPTGTAAQPAAGQRPLVVMAFEQPAPVVTPDRVEDRLETLVAVEPSGPVAVVEPKALVVAAKPVLPSPVAKELKAVVLDKKERADAPVQTPEPALPLEPVAVVPEPEHQIETFARLVSKPDDQSPALEAASPLVKKVLRRLAQAREAHVADADGSVLSEAVGHKPASTAGSIRKPTAIKRPPVVKVWVQAPDAVAAQRGLLSWVLANDIQVVSLASDPGSAGAEGRSLTSAVRTQQVTVSIRGDQLSPLLAQLNEPAGQSAYVVPQTRRRFRWWVQASDTEPETTHEVPPIGDLDWGEMLAPHLPLQPVVPVYGGDTRLMLTVEIHNVD